MSTPRFSEHAEWPPEAAQVDAGLDAFNAQTALVDVRPLACLARADDGHVLGGALGRTWGACAELQQLWVQQDRRRAGLGRALLQRFERAAAQRGVRQVYLHTFSFQAPAFYARQGYREALRLSGYTGGAELFTFIRELD